MKQKLPFGNNNNNEDAEAEQPMVNEEAEPKLVDEEPDISKEKSRAPSVHYGDENYQGELGDDADIDISDTTWNEVFRSCFCHSGQQWAMISVHLAGVLFFLYWFIFSLELLGTGAKVLTGCVAGGLFGGNTNPVASLIIGMLVTVLLQSSSTTTSIIVSLVGAGAIPVGPATYMVMGANIGTSVTNTIVAMGQMGDGDELERAFGGATVHDMFNFLSVGVLFPLELITGVLERMTDAMTKNFEPDAEGSKKSSGIKAIISPILNKIIISNKSIINDVANGESCDQYYPVTCNPAGTETYQACNKDGTIGLISCDKTTGQCPLFFQEGASQSMDTTSGGIALLLGIILLMVCLSGLVMILKRMLLGASTRIIKKATAINGYISMLIGCGITIAVQSSSVTTSFLTPLVGVGVVTVEQMYPLTLGANIGTTITSMLAAVVASTSDSMQVALIHFFFNVFGIIIWYPVPIMRRVPIRMAKALGKATRWWKGFPILYIAVVFFLLPLILLGLSSLFISTSSALVVLGVVLVVFIVLGLGKFLWWWFRKDGAAKTEASFKRRQYRKDIQARMVDEFEPMVVELQAIKEHIGYEGQQEDEVDEEVDKKVVEEAPTEGEELTERVSEEDVY